MGRSSSWDRTGREALGLEAPPRPLGGRQGTDEGAVELPPQGGGSHPRVKPLQGCRQAQG